MTEELPVQGLAPKHTMHADNGADTLGAPLEKNLSDSVDPLKDDESAQDFPEEIVSKLPNQRVLPENPTEQDLIDHREYQKYLRQQRELMATPYERKLTDEDCPKDLDAKPDKIGSTLDDEKREKINEFLDDLMKGDARVDIPIPNTAEGEQIDWEWVKYCFEDNQEAHMALNQCLEVLHKRLEGMEKYIGQMEQPEKVFEKFCLSPHGNKKWMTLQENFDAIHSKFDNMENRLDGVIKSRIMSIEQNNEALRYLIGTFNERIDKLEGIKDGLQSTE